MSVTSTEDSARGGSLHRVEFVDLITPGHPMKTAYVWRFDTGPQTKTLRVVRHEGPALSPTKTLRVTTRAQGANEPPAPVA